MNKIKIIVVILIAHTLSFGQKVEFPIYSNGLMYSDSTMKQLEFIVDSLNLKFRSCNINTTYYSKHQATAHYIRLEKGNIEAAVRDMKKNITFEEFLMKYPNAEVDSNILVIKMKYKNYNNDDEVEFFGIERSQSLTIIGKPEIYDQLVNGKWIFDYWGKDDVSDPFMWGFYFTSEFKSQAIPEVYGRMIQYADCLVDTTTQIFKENAEKRSIRSTVIDSSKIGHFLKYVNIETNKPVIDKYYDDIYIEKFRIWDSTKIIVIDSILSKQFQFTTLLQDAVKEALEKGGSNDEFEVYVGRYYSKKTALELKRSRIIVGGCSADQGPRIHALNIAILSAETLNWETFLRAHLDIMNDKFERSSDGSWAWNGRKTYIKELEELEIDVVDLLLGISLQIENPCQNHYFGSIWRIGRSLAESKYTNEIEIEILEMIKDNNLDNYNRLMMYYLFLNYNYFLKDEVKKKENVEKLEIAIKELPDYIQIQLKTIKQD
jgi:hypothetical protein